MTSDEWPRIVCERFDGEPEPIYRQRSARIAEIVSGFRYGRYRGGEAEEREQELLRLKEPEAAEPMHLVA